MNELENYANQFLKGAISFTGNHIVSYPLLVVLIASSIVNLLGAFGGSLFYQPDSSGYLSSAMALLHEGRLDAIGQNRVPGYSTFLAILFGLFDTEALLAMKFCQHFLMVLISFAVFRIGEELDETMVLALIAGILSAFMLQLQSYARIPMSEVPFATLYTFGALFFIRYVMHDRIRDLCLAILMLSVATLFKATSQLLPLVMLGLPIARLIFPKWKYLNVTDKTYVPARHLLATGLGSIIFVSTLVPWMLYNQQIYGKFGLTGTFGLNLYSNSVEYGDFWDENSPAIKDIQKQWAKVTPEQESQGVASATKSHWRHHWPSISRYMAATGLKLHEADKVYLEAAIDAIYLYPGKYFSHVLYNLWGDLTYPEITYLYLPGLEIEKEKPFYLRHTLPMENNRHVREVIYKWMESSQYESPEVIRFNNSSELTPLYGTLATGYHSLMARRHLIAIILLIGCLTIITKASNKNGLAWLSLFAIFAYVAFLIAAVVPASPRHRLPIDPIMSLIYAVGLITCFKVILMGAKGHITGWRLRDSFTYGSPAIKESEDNLDIAEGNFWRRSVSRFLSRCPENIHLHLQLSVFLLGLILAFLVNSLALFLFVVLFGIVLIL